MRIEGKAETLFEGPIRTEGHEIRASSDTQERQCDATNAGAHATPAPLITVVEETLGKAISSVMRI